MNRKRSLSKHLSRRDPDDKEISEALDEIRMGSDMVCAVMGAALVENSLRSTIEAFLVEPYDEAGLFHDQGAPFNTFKAKIVGGKALGIFGDETAADLDCIRDVRNQFAHALLKLQFDNPHLAEACSHLANREAEYEAEYGKRKGVCQFRHRFEAAVFSISTELLQKGVDILKRKLEHEKAYLAELRARFPDTEPASLQSGDDDIGGNVTTH